MPTVITKEKLFPKEERKTLKLFSVRVYCCYRNMSQVIRYNFLIRVHSVQ